MSTNEKTKIVKVVNTVKATASLTSFWMAGWMFTAGCLDFFNKIPEDLSIWEEIKLGVWFWITWPYELGLFVSNLLGGV